MQDGVDGADQQIVQLQNQAEVQLGNATQTPRQSPTLNAAST